jgi:hypothetical protein
LPRIFQVASRAVQSRIRSGVTAGLVLSLLMLGAVPGVRASSTTDACVAAYENSQKLRDDGDFVGAKREILVCGASACPQALQRECIESLTVLDARTPTVILAVRDPQKRDIGEVSVSLDDKPWTGHLDGREVAVNPGPHKLRFESAGRVAVEQFCVLREREKGRLIEVVLLPIGPPMPTQPRPTEERARSTSSIPLLTYVFGGVGVAALGTSAVFGVTALSARSEGDRCRPNCSASQVDSITQRALGADIALGIGIVAIVAATYVYLSRPGPPHSAVPTP